MAWGKSAETDSGAQSSTAGSTWTPFSSFSCTEGEIMVMVVATDNRTTTDGNTNDHTSITPANTETWTKIYEFTNGQGSAAAGACVSAWWCVVSNGMDAGADGNFTINYSGSISKMALNFACFTIGGGNTVSVVTTPSGAAPTGLADDGADPGSMTRSALPSAEHLYVRGIAGETNTDTGPTATTNWTAFGYGPTNSTTGGGAAANIAACAEYRINTSTTETSDPTWTSADHASLMFALDEVAGGPAASLLPPPFRYTSTLYNR